MSAAKNNHSGLKPVFVPIMPRHAVGTATTVATVTRFDRDLHRTASCTGCGMRNVCIPAGLDAREVASLEERIGASRRIREGEPVYGAGQHSGSLYAIRTGFVKTATVTDDGREQVTGFHMMGEIIGLDAIGGGGHDADAVALEDTHVCEIPVAALSALAHDVPSLQRKVYTMISQELRQQREAMLFLGSMRAEERLASFLLNLGRRYHERGYSATRFNLRMSRGEIGSYLGLRLETISRLFSRLQVEQLLRVDSRWLEILDPTGLKALIGRPLS